VFAKKHTGKTIADEYAALGLDLSRADIDRINGWGEILTRLGDPARGVSSRLFISARCAGLIDTLPLLQHNPARPEDVLKWDTDDDGIGGDDYADGARYAVMAGADDGRYGFAMGY
jgi:hypothetical protein